MRGQITETTEQALLDGFRQFLWMAVCWNDHNFREGTVTKKCREVCQGLDIKTVEEANELLDGMAELLSWVEDYPKDTRA